MDGVHDLGGKQGFGRVDQASDKVFSDRWEASVFAMVNASATAGAWPNVDRFRHAIERIDPEAYLNHGYYGRWLGGLETLLVEAGIVDSLDITDKAIEKGALAEDLIAARPANKPDPMGPAPTSTGSDRELSRLPLFKVGDEVTALNNVVPGHTRLPAYVRGKRGQVVLWHQGWVYPDTNAHGAGEQPQHLYTVKFTGDELWGQQGFSVCIDLFEPYITAS
jgi:nitrile hydratase